MATQRKIFGRIPTYRGDWSEGVPVKEKFRFTYRGSEFQALRDGLTIPPLNDNNELNEGWIVISNGTEAYRAGDLLERYLGESPENPEFIRVYTDADDRLLWWINSDGSVDWGSGVPRPIQFELKRLEQFIKDGEDSILENIESINNYLNETLAYKESHEYIKVLKDADERVINAIIPDGTNYLPKTEIEELSLDGDIVDNDAVKSQVYTVSPEFIGYTADADGRVLEGFKSDGTKYIDNIETENVKAENVESKLIDSKTVNTEIVNTNKIGLTSDGMTDLVNSLKNEGYLLLNDWSSYISKDGDYPLILPIPQFAKLNILCDLDLASLSKVGREDAVEGVNYNIPTEVEYWDGLGNYFKKEALISGQGNSTMNDPMKSIAMDLFDSEVNGDAFAIKFGNWVAQDSFHVKAFWKDSLKGICNITYNIGEEIIQALDCRTNRNHSELSSIDAAGGCGTSKYDFGVGPLCHPDGFPIEVYRKGEYYGICVLSLKKHRANYSMDKSDYESVLLDSVLGMKWGNSDNINWANLEIRNPKTLYCINTKTDSEGNVSYIKYDGDFPVEIIDETMPYYDPNNKDHVNTAKTKRIIKTACDAINLVNAASTTEEKKVIMQEYFDVESLIAYIIFCDLTNNQDGIVNNAQLTIYNGKLGYNIYDCDSCLGKTWAGGIWSLSGVRKIVGKSTSNPLGLTCILFEQEINSKYALLRNNGIITVGNLYKKVAGWCKRIGYEAYNRNIKKWPNPSYKAATNVNSDNWRLVVWDSNTLPDYYSPEVTYSKGMYCRTYNPSQSYNESVFECVLDCIGVPPIKESSSLTMPDCFYDSLYRYKEWFKIKITSMDEYYKYNN